MTRKIWILFPLFALLFFQTDSFLEKAGFSSSEKTLHSNILRTSGFSEDIRPDDRCAGRNSAVLPQFFSLRAPVRVFSAPGAGSSQKTHGCGRTSFFGAFPQQWTPDIFSEYGKPRVRSGKGKTFRENFFPARAGPSSAA